MQHGGPESVDSVMVDGRWLMRGQALLAFDEAAALTEGEGSGRRFAGAHGSAAGDVGRSAAGARLGATAQLTNARSGILVVAQG